MPWCLRPNFLIWATPESCELFQQAPVKYSRRPDYPVAEILKYSTYSSFNWKLRFWLFLCKTFSKYTYSVYFSSLSIVGYPWKAALTKVKSYGRKSIFGKFYIVKRWHPVLAEKNDVWGKKYSYWLMDNMSGEMLLNIEEIKIIKLHIYMANVHISPKNNLVWPSRSLQHHHNSYQSL